MAKTTAAQPLLFSKYGLLLLTALFLSAGYFLWQSWPSLIISSMQWQKEVNSQLSELLYDARANSLSAGLSLAGLSFIYGMLHSLGPGHGKLIVSTYLATHPTKVKISLMLTIVSALLQAVVAIALVSALLVIFNSSMHEVNGEANRFVLLSFYLVVLLGLAIVWRNLRTLYKLSPFCKQQAIQINAIKPMRAVSKPLSSVTKTHLHSESCNCGHKHCADAEAINRASSCKEYLVIILSIGIRPCTGAVMVLLFANLLDIYWLGAVSALLMAMGTALTTSIIAIMTVKGRQWVRGYINANKQQAAGHAGAKENSVNTLRVAGPLVRLAGGALLILIGAILLSAQPAGMSPVF